MQQFKPRPPKIEGIRFDGTVTNAFDVIEVLNSRDIVASYVPELEQQVHADREPRKVAGHILIFSRGDHPERVHAGDWIMWDPTLHDGHIRSWTQFDIMTDETVERRFMDREKDE